MEMHVVLSCALINIELISGTQHLLSGMVSPAKVCGGPGG